MATSIGTGFGFAVIGTLGIGAWVVAHYRAFKRQPSEHLNGVISGNLFGPALFYILFIACPRLVVAKDRCNDKVFNPFLYSLIPAVLVMLAAAKILHTSLQRDDTKAEDSPLFNATRSKAVDNGSTTSIPVTPSSDGNNPTVSYGAIPDTGSAPSMPTTESSTTSKLLAQSFGSLNPNGSESPSTPYQAEQEKQITRSFCAIQ